jgi:hypothetical protein
MNLHKAVADMIAAQNKHNSRAYADCFSETAIVHDEGKTHQGREEIQQWIEKSDEEYHAEMKPLSYKETGADALLTAEVSGKFPGSPAVLKFHIGLKDDHIQSLSITG